MTDLVVQRTPHDCSIACLSMLARVSYERVIELAGDDFDPVNGMWSTHRTLARLGFAGEDFGDMQRGFSPSAEFFRELSWGRRALLSVPSLNNPGGWHHVFWGGSTVFDPSPLKTHSAWAELLPDEMILFRETAHG